MVTATSGSVQPRGGRRDLQHGARRRGLDSSRGGGRCTSRPLPHRRAPVVRSSPGRFCPTRALASTRSLCMAARPTGRADRPGPRSTADDGTLTRERHRLACGSPARAPGRRPGGVTLGFSDRCPVPDGDGDIRFRRGLAATWPRLDQRRRRPISDLPLTELFPRTIPPPAPSSTRPLPPSPQGGRNSRSPPFAGAIGAGKATPGSGCRALASKRSDI